MHLEYLEAHPTGLRYTAFCDVYREWRSKAGVFMRQVHKAGENCFVDYSGKKPHYVDARTGELVDVKLFVAVLGASNYTYAEATETQQVTDFIGAHVRAYSYFGGVTDRSPYVADMRRDFEGQALHERAAIGELDALSRQPLRLPSPQELAEDRILALDALHEATGADVEPARERLRQLLKGGSILLHPDGAAYVARGELLPLEVLVRDPETKPPRRGAAGRCPRSVARAGFEPTTFG